MMAAGDSESERQRRILHRIYLLHLLVPLLLLADALASWLRGGFDLTDRGGVLVALVSSAWLLTGLATLGASRGRPRFAALMAKPLLGVSVACLALLPMELAARLVLGQALHTPFLYRPHTSYVKPIDSAVFPGVSGPVRFTINGAGLRGPDLVSPAAFKIVAVGGSTTACTELDDSREWPHLLMEDMNRAQAKKPVWVANAGVNGHTTVHHLLLLRALPVLREADAVILLIGANDLQTTLASKGASTQAHLEEEALLTQRQVTRSRDPRSPLFERSAIFALLGQAGRMLQRWFRSHDSSRAGPDFWTARRQLRNASRIVSPPDLGLGRKEYRQRVLLIAQECRKLHLRCIYLTQPFLWRSQLSPAEQRLLWFGWVGPMQHPEGYLSPQDAAQAMTSYNQDLLALCRDQRLECYDLAAALSPDSSLFFDDLHFNDAGSRRLARFVADQLLADPPFGGDSSPEAAARAQAATTPAGAEKR